MPNTFGIPATSSTPAITANLIDPREIRENRFRFRRESISELSYANSFYVPAGIWPARGWILVSRSDYNRLAANKGLYGVDFQLNIDEFDANAPGLTFSNLVIVQARCVTTGLISDANAIYLIEITDQRGMLWNRWFYDGTISQYNVRSPAYPNQFYFNSTFVGTPWTWDGLVGQIWNQLGVLGTYPGLPIVPTSTPENWIFPGVPHWPALNRVLDHIGCRVSVDLTNETQPYGIVSLGAEDDTFTNLTNQYSGRVQDDLDWIDVGSGRVPSSVTVLFHRRNQYYGTEETVRNDNLQWQSTPLYQIGVAAPIQFSGAQGAHIMWDDFQVQFDVDGNPLAADVITATAIAAERTTQYFNRIYWATLGYMNRTYAGIIPFTCGSQVDGVAWRQDFDGQHSFLRESEKRIEKMENQLRIQGKEKRPRQREGWTTQIIRGENPPWPLVVAGLKP